MWLRYLFYWAKCIVYVSSVRCACNYTSILPNPRIAVSSLRLKHIFNKLEKFMRKTKKYNIYIHVNIYWV